MNHEPTLVIEYYFGNCRKNEKKILCIFVSLLPGGDEGELLSDELVVSVSPPLPPLRPRSDPDRLKFPDPICDETGKGVGVADLAGSSSSISSSSSSLLLAAASCFSSEQLTSFRESRGKLDDERERTFFDNVRAAVWGGVTVETGRRF